MKTLQVCSYYTDSKLYANLFRALDDLGEPSDVFYFTDNKKDTSHLDQDLIVSKAYRKFDRLLFFEKHRKVYKDALRLLDLSSYSHSHAHSLMSNGYISNRLYRDQGLPYIAAVRRTDLFFFMKYKPYLKPLAARILKEAEALIFLSPVFLDKALDIFKGWVDEDSLRAKSYIIPNGIDEVFFQSPPQDKVLGQETNLVFIGKVVDPNKNVSSLVKLVDEMNGEGDKVKLKLIGSISKDFEHKLKSNPNISLMGRLGQQEIINTLKEDHIFIMPSYTETFGLVYVEAMSQGLPVIYTRGQGFDGQFEEGEVGYRVGAKSLDEMKAAIGKIRANYTSMSKNAVRGSHRYKWPDIAEEYKEIYQNLRLKSGNE